MPKSTLQFKAIVNLFILQFFCIVLFTANSFAQAPVISYYSPQNYPVGTPITPLRPNNTGGPVPATIYGQVSTVATGFNTPAAVAIDVNGNLFVDDWGTNQIREVNAAGTVTLFAGNGSAAAVNGPGAAASFYWPDGIITDAAGNLYIGDQGNNLIRKITSTGAVSTFAGSGAAGATDGADIAASFNSPRGLAIDASGNIYVADQANNLIRKITPAGVVTTYAGNGTGGLTNGTGNAVSFNTPTGVGVDNLGNVYVADMGNNVIRKITPQGTVTTFATGFNAPRDVRVDGSGNVYITEQNGNTIKRISPAGVSTTIAGTGQIGSNNGNGNVATFNGPIGLVLDGKGNMFVADAGNNILRKIIITGYTIDKPLPPGLSFDPTTGIISGTPTAASPVTVYTITAYNGSGSSSTVLTLSVGPTLLQPTITFPNSDPPIQANNIIDPGAVSTNTQIPITYASSNPAVAIVLPNGQVQLIGPGTTTIIASQISGNNYEAGSASETLVVKSYEYVTIPTIPGKSLCDADFSLGANSTNTSIPLTYASSNQAVATVSAAGMVHIVGVGSTTITVSQAGNAYYTAADPKQAVLNVTIPPPPKVTIAVDYSTACVGVPVTFTATVSDMGTPPVYQWQVNGTNVGSNSPTFTTTALLATDVVQCVAIIGTCKLTGTSNAITGITALPYTTPSVSIQSVPVTGVICTGNTLTFTATATNGGTNPTYQWQVNGINAGANSATFSTNGLNNGDNVTCVLTNNGGACLTTSTAVSNSIAISITAPPVATIGITASANNVYAGTPIVFTATCSYPVFSYQWQVNGVNAGTNSSTFTSTALKTGDAVTCIILTSAPCAVPLTSQPVIMTILAPPTLHIPNTFTPNSDGTNDLWEIPELSFYPNCLVNIYNRYGAMLYQSKGYSKAWDGFYNGKELPAATYYYIIELNNNTTTKYSGYITIIR